MTKFKKLFLAGLAFILTLSMALQATPAFALGNSGESSNVLPPGPSQMLTCPAQFAGCATIKSMVVMETYPPQLKITGTLPSRCFQLKVFIRDVSPEAQNASVRTISIWVGGVAPMGMLCVRGIQSFTTTVTLDPAKLNLAPGKYVAIVNPVNGQSRFKTGFTIPKLETVLATISKVVTLESYPPQFKISGTLPSTCYTLRVSAPQVAGRVISVFLRGTAPAGMACVLMLKPFTTSLTIDPAKLKLAPGKYTVLFNPINGVSRFKTEVFVGID